MTGCGTGKAPDRIRAKSEIDMAAWRSELIGQYHAQSEIDMDRMYELTVKGCNTSLEDWTLQLAYEADHPSSVTPDLHRANMERVCPGRAHVIIDALQQNQDRGHDVERICSMSPGARTEQQQLFLDAIGPRACGG